MRSIYTVFILLFALMTSAQSQQTAEDWYNEARTLYNQSKYDEAIRANDEAIKLNSSEPKYWNIKGNALGMQGKYDDAIEAFDEAVRLDPNYATAWYNKGVALGNLGAHENALMAFDEAIRLDSNYTSAWNNKAIALDQLGRTAESKAAYAKVDELVIEAEEQPINALYDESLDRDSTNITIWFKKAHALLDENLMKSATDVYDEANEVCHPNATVWIKEGMAIKNKKLTRPYTEEAIRCYDRAIEILEKSPENASALNNKGVVLTYQADTDAERYLGEEDIEKRIAHEQYRTDKRKQALECFKKAIKLNPKCWVSWYNKGVILYAVNFDQSNDNYEEIDECFKKARALSYNETNCLLVNDKWDAEYQTKIKMSELPLKTNDVERVAQYHHG